MGKERRERKVAQRKADAQRRLGFLQEALKNVRRALSTNQQKMHEIRDEVPPDAPCCVSCWLAAVHPEYDDMAEKAERQAKEVARLEQRITTVQALLEPHVTERRWPLMLVSSTAMRIMQFLRGTR